MTDQPVKTPQPREPLAAPTSYQPVANNQLFPAWERNLKFALLGAAIVVGVAGFRYWKAQQPAPLVPVVHFSKSAQWTSGEGITMAPAIAHSGRLAAYA